MVVCSRKSRGFADWRAAIRVPSGCGASASIASVQDQTHLAAFEPKGRVRVAIPLGAVTQRRIWQDFEKQAKRSERAPQVELYVVLLPFGTESRIEQRLGKELSPELLGTFQHLDIRWLDAKIVLKVVAAKANRLRTA